MTDIVLFPAHHWHLVWVTSYPSNCLSFLASSALYSLSFSMILIIIYSLILRPRLLLCFQVMYSFTEWFIGEGRGKREGKALRWKISKFHNFWVSETVPKFLGVLRPFPARWKHWAFVLFALFCNILWFSYILNCVDLWLVFHHYPRRKFLWKHKQETTPWSETLRTSSCHHTMDSVIYPVLAEYCSTWSPPKMTQGKQKHPSPPPSHLPPLGYFTVRKSQSSPAREVGSVIEEVTMNAKLVSSIPSLSIYLLETNQTCLLQSI